MEKLFREDSLCDKS